MGDIITHQVDRFHTFSDVALEVNPRPPVEEPPLAIMEALGKLTLYHMQERAQEAINEGNIEEATRRLERLATRLLALGEPVLAERARTEAYRVLQTSQLSDEGRKSLKYQTRLLLLGPQPKDEGR
jgi:Ca-activated chloride channel homolog